jgi:glycosyltransferase involved in cell wall biosynthesis
MVASAASTASPLVSVVIPCFNHGRFLREAVASVLAQRHASYEIVVVDDGSTDDTAQVAAAFPQVRYVRQENQGLAAARNTGVRASHGPYLVFLDADDRLLPAALDAGVRLLEASPECAFVSGHFHYVEHDGALRAAYAQETIPADTYLAFLRGNYVGMHATVMYRRSALEAAGGFDVSLPACEDYDLYLRLARRHPALRHDTVVAEYRQHDRNMSRDLELMLKTVLRVLGAQWRWARERPAHRRGYRAGRRAWQLHYGEMLHEEMVRRWARGERTAAARLAVTLLRHAPRYVGATLAASAHEALSRRRVYRLWRRARGLGGS